MSAFNFLMKVVGGVPKFLTYCCGDCESPPPPPPSPCGCSGTASCYRIAAYNDGYLAACSGCDFGIGSPWEGTFPGTMHAGDCPDGATWSGASGLIEGRVLSLGGTVLTYQATGGAGGTCRYLVSVVCNYFDEASGVHNARLIWRGEKTEGGTPAGIYNRLEGCSTRSQLTIEACP